MPSHLGGRTERLAGVKWLGELTAEQEGVDKRNTGQLLGIGWPRLRSVTTDLQCNQSFWLCNTLYFCLDQM